jgi:hypothetical protein
MPVDLNQFGNLGRFLKAHEWSITPTNVTKGTASCNAYTGEILIKPWAYRQLHKPGRIRDYVFVHELAHAAHAQLFSYDVYDLAKWRRLDKRAAIEVVADAWCLEHRPDRIMRRWVSQSVLWHGRVGYRYSMGDVISPEAKEVVRRIRTHIKEWETSDAATPAR